jgi:hypothetical protein
MERLPTDPRERSDRPNENPAEQGKRKAPMHHMSAADFSARRGSILNLASHFVAGIRQIEQLALGGGIPSLLGKLPILDRQFTQICSIFHAPLLTWWA